MFFNFFKRIKFIVFQVITSCVSVYLLITKCSFCKLKDVQKVYGSIYFTVEPSKESVLDYIENKVLKDTDGDLCLFGTKTNEAVVTSSSVRIFK